MNKKVMAVAVAGAFVAPAALAQTSNVQIYGRAVLGLETIEAKGATAGSAADIDDRFRVFDMSSRVGLRGTEDLGGGLKAIFQIETGVNVDSGNNSAQNSGTGQTNGSTGFWASRDSFVGLDSNFGRLTFGRQSIFWVNGVNAQFSSNYINEEIPWTNGSGLGRVSTGAVTRTSNVAQYTTPNFGGVNATLSYSPNAQEGVGPIGGGTDADGAIYGGTVRATFGPFYGQFDYVKNEANSLLNGAPHAEHDHYKGGVSWGYLPGARIGVIYVRTETNAAIGTALGDEVRQDGWTVNWEHTFGNIQLMAQYGQLGDIKDCDTATLTISCDASKAKAWMVGGRYLLSKRTWLFASYNEIDNKENQYSDWGGTRSAFPGGVPAANNPFGADPQVIAVGIFHNF